MVTELPQDPPGADPEVAGDPLPALGWADHEAAEDPLPAAGQTCRAAARQPLGAAGLTAVTLLLLSVWALARHDSPTSIWEYNMGCIPGAEIQRPGCGEKLSRPAAEAKEEKPVANGSTMARDKPVASTETPVAKSKTVAKAKPVVKVVREKKVIKEKPAVPKPKPAPVPKPKPAPVPKPKPVVKVRPVVKAKPQRPAWVKVNAPQPNSFGRCSLNYCNKGSYCQSNAARGNPVCCQEHSVKILRELRDFFRQRNMEWTLAGGLLLGAIREQDFISWENDIDVQLPMNEFQRLFGRGPSLWERSDVPWRLFFLTETIGRACIIYKGRYKQYGHHTSFHWNSIPYVDLYPCRSPWGTYPECHKHHTLMIRGDPYPSVKHDREYIIREYGSDWRQPKPGVHGSNRRLLAKLEQDGESLL